MNLEQFLNTVDEMCGKDHGSHHDEKDVEKMKKKKAKKKAKTMMGRMEGERKGVSEQTLGGYNLKDNILDDITLEELQDTVYSNIPKDKIDKRSIQKEFESLLKTKISDARFIAKKVIQHMVKNLTSMSD